ncbi:hypothetical protein [Brachybacterium sp.]|uniref:hypothetical protein n=1 Tax=Brachybacterium sp. TaxID=1891286 RepID=UPI002ED4B66C
MTFTRFNPDPDKPYGSCVTCGLELATTEDAQAHRSATVEPVNDGAVVARGHRTQGTNPPREERVRRYIERVLEDAAEDNHDIDFSTRTFTVTDSAVDEAIEALLRDAERGDLAYPEITANLKHEHEFYDAWLEAIEEHEDAPDPVHPDQLDLLEELSS